MFIVYVLNTIYNWTSFGVDKFTSLYLFRLTHNFLLFHFVFCFLFFLCPCFTPHCISTFLIYFYYYITCLDIDLILLFAESSNNNKNLYLCTIVVQYILVCIIFYFFLSFLIIIIICAACLILGVFVRDRMLNMNANIRL